MPKLEEINDDDIDNMDMDIAQFDPTLRSPIAPKIVPTVKRSYDKEEQPLFPQGNMPNMGLQNQHSTAEEEEEDLGATMLVDQYGRKIKAPADFKMTSKEEMLKYQVIYPCYFDSRRSHAQGRRVAKKYAVENPFAKTINDACLHIGLTCILEPDKTHPQDFGNPGRVRVLLKNEGSLKTNVVKNKRDLFNLIGTYLKRHPTSMASVKELKLPQFDPELISDKYKPRRVPFVKGIAMNDIVPLNSPFTMGHPQLVLIYTKDPQVSSSSDDSSTYTQPSIPQVPKKKILKVRR